MGKPSFLIIGMERAGTTSLYYNLCKHSQVIPAYTKEIEFFGKHYDKGEKWYHIQFQEGFTGEATPTYYWNPEVPKRIKKYNPDIKIILLRRDYFELVYSKYHQQVAKGVETLSLAEAIAYERLRTIGELERVRGLPYNYYPSHYAEYAYRDRYKEHHFERWNDFDVLELQQGYDMNVVFKFLGLENEEHEWEHLNKGSYEPMTERERMIISGVMGEQGNSFGDWAHDDLGLSKK